MSKHDEEPLGNPLCLHCGTELAGHVLFCPKCGCPATPAALSMPYELVLQALRELGKEHVNAQRRATLNADTARQATSRTP